MTSEVTCEEPQVLATQTGHVWYKNNGVNETNWYKAFLALQVTASDLQMTSEGTCDLKDDPQVFAMQISHVWYQNDGLNLGQLNQHQILPDFKSHSFTKFIWRSDVVTWRA